MSEPFVVAASRLNLRASPGLDAPVVAQLAKGSRVRREVGSADDSWWYVKVDGARTEGFVARRYVALPDAGSDNVVPGINDVLWDLSRAAIVAKVRYKLGDKASAKGAIDCSGWVAEITIKAFDAMNRAAAPEILYDSYDHGALRTHSDGQIAGVAARTGSILRGSEVDTATLREGMLVGCNFGNYGWERNVPPRRYGIDHIVQVVRSPDDGTLHVSQSSSSGGGVTLEPLAGWLARLRARGLTGPDRIFAVDPFQMADPHTRFASEARARAVAVPKPVVAPAAPATAAGHRPAFSGRGAYTYLARDLVRQFGSIDAAVAEMSRCGLSHLWVRIHGIDYVGDSRSGDLAQQKRLVDAARRAGIAVAGWGWCQGADPSAEAALALQALRYFELDDYVADIEQGVNAAKWTAAEVRTLLEAVRPHTKGLCVSSHGFIDYQEPRIFKDAAALVDCFNPQAYWFVDKPNRKMLSFVKVSEDDYPLQSPAAYVRLCYDRWTALYGRPLVMSGHTAPEADLSEELATARLARFLDSFVPPDGLVGVNYWHWGQTSRAQRDLLAGARGRF